MDEKKDRPGILFEAVTVYRSSANIERVRGRVDLQRLRQASVSLHGSTHLVTFKPEKTNILHPIRWSVALLKLAFAAADGSGPQIPLLPRLFHLLLREQWANVHGVAELHVRQFARHGDGCVPAIKRTSLSLHIFF